VQSPDFRERFAKRGAEVVIGGPEGLAKTFVMKFALRQHHQVGENSGQMSCNGKSCS